MKLWVVKLIKAPWTGGGSRFVDSLFVLLPLFVSYARPCFVVRYLATFRDTVVPTQSDSDVIFCL